jgi:hypothetical protein
MKILVQSINLRQISAQLVLANLAQAGVGW